MAYIEGLKESEQALAEIKKILKEVEGINEFMSVDNPTTLYKLSFTVKNTVPQDVIREETVPTADTYAGAYETEDVSIKDEHSFPEGEIAKEKKPSKKAKKIISYTAPLICDDKETLYHFIQLYKERKVRTVRQLMETHRIRLTEDEMAILGNPS